MNFLQIWEVTCYNMFAERRIYEIDKENEIFEYLK